MNGPSILIVFDPATWIPEVFLNGKTDEETEELKVRADRMIDVLEKEQERGGHEEK